MSCSDSEEDVPALIPVASIPPEVHANSNDNEEARAAAGDAAPAEAGTTASVAPPVPVALITGYLGAGKSTLVNYILTAKHGYRCAVLLNEWADSADIEKALIKEPEGQTAAPVADWVQLENGCICCSVKNDMVKALESLLQQRDRFDYILIESTGLCNPGPVAAALWTDAELESGICLDAIVTVVDAKLIRRQLAEPRPAGVVNEAQQQVAFADVVLLNKTDLVSREELGLVEAELRDINSEASVVRCQRCEIDLALILNTGIYTAGARAPGTAAAAVASATASAAENGLAHSAAQQQEQQEGEHSLECGPTCSHQSHVHTQQQQHYHQVCTVTLFEEQPLSLQRLRHWLDELLWEGGEATADLMRIKGLLSVAESPCKQVLQGVHELYDIVQGPAWQQGEARRSKLVFIGRRLDREALRQGVASCIAGAAGAGNGGSMSQLF